jgi:hypothetical protein
MTDSRISKIFKFFDIHGAPISLTFNKKAQHKSVIGGMITLTGFTGLLIYFLILLQKVVNRETTILTS